MWGSINKQRSKILNILILILIFNILIFNILKCWDEKAKCKCHNICTDPQRSVQQSASLWTLAGCEEGGDDGAPGECLCFQLRGIICYLVSPSIFVNVGSLWQQQHCYSDKRHLPSNIFVKWAVKSDVTQHSHCV